MFFAQEGNQITLFDMDGFKLVQEKNPATQEYFQSPEEAMDWAKQYLLSTYGYVDYANFQSRLTTSNSSRDIEKMTVGTRCRLHLTEATGQLQQEYFMMVVNQATGESTELEFYFEDGVASASFLPKRAGTYVLDLNGTYMIGDVPCKVLEDINKFSFIAE